MPLLLLKNRVVCRMSPGEHLFEASSWMLPAHLLLGRSDKGVLPVCKFRTQVMLVCPTQVGDVSFNPLVKVVSVSPQYACNCLLNN